VSGWLLVFLVAGAVWLALDRLGGQALIAVVAVLAVLLDALTAGIDQLQYLADRDRAYQRWWDMRRRDARARLLGQLR